MKKQILLCCLITLVSASGLWAARAQKCDCPPKVKPEIKYKLGLSNWTIREPILLIAQVSVSPEHFNDTDIVKLAKRLNKDFCDEQRLQVGIFDEHREAKRLTRAVDYLKGQGETGPLRGYYTLDRTTGEEKITFSRKRNNPLDEAVIILGESKKR